MLAPAIAFVDLETTGATGLRDRITEIGIVRVAEGEVVEEWSTLVDPQRSIPEDIRVLTGITNEMVRGKPTFAELCRELRERLDGHLFVAHNARFDYGFLKHEFRRCGVAFTADVLCTVRLSRRLYPEAHGHSLDALVERHGLQDVFIPAGDVRTGRHSALGDARAIWRFVQALYREREAGEIEAAVRRLLKIPSLPPQLPPDALASLPEGPGVYRFYGVNELPLYIGKSVNLRDRIRSHFSSDWRSANDERISSEIRRIEVDETAGDLGALLTEARLVKALMPLHNHRLRRKRDACFVRVPALSSAPEVVAAKDVDWEAQLTPCAMHAPEMLYGPFPTRRHVRAMLEGIAGEHGLCWRLLGWENRGGPCWARQVGKCRGACLGEETAEVHNLRLATALAKHRVAEWPWDGPIAIRERHPEARFEEAHVFDRWCHVGTARDAEELAALAETRVAIDFDPDIYKILSGFLRKNPYAVLPLGRKHRDHREEEAESFAD